MGKKNRKCKDKGVRKMYILFSSRKFPGNLVEDTCILQRLEKHNVNVIIDEVVFYDSNDGSEIGRSVYLTTKEKVDATRMIEMLSSINLVRLKDSELAKNEEIFSYRVDGNASKLTSKLKEFGDCLNIKHCKN